MIYQPAAFALPRVAAALVKVVWHTCVYASAGTVAIGNAYGVAVVSVMMVGVVYTMCMGSAASGGCQMSR